MKKIILLGLVSALILVSCTQQEQPAEVAPSPTEESSQPAQTTSEPTSEPQSTASVSTAVQDEAVLIQTATITGGAHDSSATINIYSDNSVEVLNFNYDGRAPDVYIAIGNIVDGGTFEKVALISDKITVAQENTTLALAIEPNEVFNAVSIYCDQYSDDFGSIVLTEVTP